MSIFASPRFLSRVMWADAASCAATGLVQVVATEGLAGLTGLPASLLLGTGMFLLGYALVAAWIARRDPSPRGLVALVALGNLGWALGCITLLAGGLVAVTTMGMAWVVAQIVTVLLLADLQWAGLRGTRSATSAARA
jgi:hypothetical protein